MGKRAELAALDEALVMIDSTIARAMSSKKPSFTAVANMQRDRVRVMLERARAIEESVDDMPTEDDIRAEILALPDEFVSVVEAALKARKRDGRKG